MKGKIINSNFLESYNHILSMEYKSYIKNWNKYKNGIILGVIHFDFTELSIFKKKELIDETVRAYLNKNHLSFPDRIYTEYKDTPTSEVQSHVDNMVENILLLLGQESKANPSTEYKTIRERDENYLKKSIEISKKYPLEAFAFSPLNYNIDHVACYVLGKEDEEETKYQRLVYKD